MTSSTSVRTRTSALLVVTVAAFVIIFLVVQRSQSAQVEVLMQERVLETSRVFERILDLRASGARIHADDYTRWDDFVTFARKPDPAWGKLYLTENIATFGIDAAWVLDNRFRLIFIANPANEPALAPLPVPLADLASTLKAAPVRHFFARTPRGVIELWTSSIQPSDDLARRTPPAGYYVVGRLWTPTRLAELSKVTDGSATLAPIGARDERRFVWDRTGRIRIGRPLPGLRGEPVARLSFETMYAVVPHVNDTLRFSLILMLSWGLVSFIVVAAALTHWVTGPLAVIATSLRNEDPAFLDSTIRRHDELGHLARLVRDFFAQRISLIEARKVAEAAAEAKQHFVATISHELRTPMNGILGYARFGVQDAPTAEREELREYFEQVAECGTRLLALLDQLLDVAKFAAGRMKLELLPGIVEDVVRDAAGEFAGLYRERGLRLDLKLVDDPRPVLLDRLRVLQVLRNLLSNAAKFTPSGGTVILSVETTQETARVAVEDSGVGIPAGELELVFDEFSQASTTRSGSGGTGLGLALCREIVRAHGGRIWAENGPQKGARFVFELPVAGRELDAAA